MSHQSGFDAKCDVLDLDLMSDESSGKGYCHGVVNRSSEPRLSCVDKAPVRL